MAPPGRISLTLLLILAFAMSPQTVGSQSQRVTLEKIKAALPEFERIIDQGLRKTGVPGVAVAIVFRDEAVFLKGYGVREAGKSVAIDPDTVFQLASVSKPIASTVVAAVVGDGRVRWDDPVIKHDPGFQMYDSWVTREVTLRDLFAHRSGLPDHAGDALEDMGFDRDAVLFRLRYQKPKGEFRASYFYTNFGLTEAAVAAARAAGKSWEDLSADRLYRPLGMKSTSSRYADYVKAANRALLHVRVGDKFVARYQRDPEAQSPAGGVSSTVRDMVQWVRLQLGKGKFNGQQLVSAEALGETHVPHMVSSRPADPSVDRAGFYGLGWNVSHDEYGRVQLGHSGGFAMGAATNVTLLPAEGLGIVVLSNAEPIGFPEAISRSFLDLLSLGKTERDWVDFLGKIFAQIFKPEYGTAVDYSKPVANKTAALALSAYSGTYRNDLFGDIEVAVNGGSLDLRQGPKKTTFRMAHYDRDVFTYQPVGENAYGLSSVAFNIGIDKRAASVVIENLNIHGDGLFVLIPQK